MDGIGRKPSSGRADVPERARLPVALASVTFTAGFACLCARAAGSDGRSAAWLVAANGAGLAGFAWWSGDRVLRQLLLAAVACGWTELLADALCVRCTGTLDYSVARSALVWESPWWMPFLWAVVAVQVGVGGQAAARRLGVVRGAGLAGLLGAGLIAFYEQMAWGAHWWRYRRCLLCGQVPVYIVAAEAIIGVGLALLGHFVSRAGSWRAAFFAGVAAGAVTVLGGVVGWGTVEFLGRGARPLWPFR